MSAFILLVFTAVAVSIFLYNPAGRLYKWSYGRTRKQLREDMDQWKTDDWFSKGCLTAYILVFSLLLTFLVEPIYILSAISGDVGRREFAYVAFFVLVCAWVNGVRSYRKKPSEGTKTNAITVVTEDGETVGGEISEDNIVLDVSNPNSIKNLTWRIFFAVPTFYLVYLLLITMKLIAG